MEEAVRRADLKLAQELIRNGADVSEPTGRPSLLIRAITRGYHCKDIALALLAAGADVHVKDQRGWTALHWACVSGLEEVVQALIDRGSRVNERNSFGRTPLMLAEERGETRISMCLLRAGASCEGLSKRQEEALFRLRHTLGYTHPERDLSAIHTLLRNGWSLSILSTEEQEELLHLACRKNDLFVAHTLLKNGCGAKKLIQADLLHLVHNLTKQEVEELLHNACCEGSMFVVRTLLKSGCSVSILSTEEQEQLLYHACQESDVFVARTLLKNGCSAKKLTQDDLLYLIHNLSKQEVEELLHQEIEELLHHGCCEGSVFAVHTLLKNGCNDSILSTEEQEQLLHLACHESDVFFACTLLKNGCSVSILSTEEQEQLLHLACRKSDVLVARTFLSVAEQEDLHLACREDDAFVVHALLEDGCSVSILSREEQEELLHLACHEDDVFVVHTLLKDGCTVSILSAEDQEQLLHLACRKSDVLVARTFLSVAEQEDLHLACREDDAFVVHALLEDGCSVSILSREEQEELLHLACHEDDVFVVHTLLKDGCTVSILSAEDQEQLLHHACREDVFVVHALLKDGCSVSILLTEEQEQLLYLACCESDVLVVEALLASGCNVNCVCSTGYTPLMAATEKGHEELVKKLILVGANLGKQTRSGDTALHLAASGNNIQCGILLAEGGASVRTKNKLSQTSLDLAKTEFKEAIKQALSFTTRKALCIIGNAEGGKSTLIAALQAESNSFLGRIFNRFRRVSDRRQRTAGIETVSHSSQRYGEVLFFDFAGQDDYHGPHQMFLESLLSKPGVSMTLLLVVKMTEEEEAILHQLHRWLVPVALMATPASPSQVIIIGSFLDKVKSKDEATAKLTRCIKATRKDLEELPLEFVGSCFLNCRQPQSKGINKICDFLQEIPIPEFSATHTHYSLAWVLSQIRSSITARAVQLQEFSMWVQDNKDNLPQAMPPPEEVCQDLSAAGHALYLPNKEDPPKSWLVLDLPSILHDVYGTLFSQSKEIVNQFGLLHCHHMAKLFPGMDLEMVQQLLISLEFCLPVDPSILRVDLSKLTQSEEASGWLFFPALISANPPQPTLECLPQQSVCYLCWQLRSSKKHSISARILQAILLRLAAHFVVKQYNEEGVQQHCCSIWWNGIAWQSRKGIDITVHIINNRVIQVISASVVPADKSCQYLIAVISDILSTVHRLSPKLAAGAYIVHPPKVATSPEDITAPPPKELFLVEGIRSCIRDGEEYALSLKNSNIDRSSRAVVADLFGGYTPSLEDIGRISWPQPQTSQPEPSSGLSQPGLDQPEPGHTQPLSGTTQPERSQPEPNQPQPNQPGPNQPQPSRSEPSQPQPSQPEPNQTQSSSGQSQPDVLLQTVHSECIL